MPPDPGQARLLAAQAATVARLSAVYLRYLQVLRRLEYVHHHLIQPQARLATWRGVEACTGRLVHAWHALAAAAGGDDFVDLHAEAAALGLTPDDLEVPLKAAFDYRRASKLAAHEVSIAAAVQAAAAAAAAATASAASAAAAAASGDHSAASEDAAGSGTWSEGAPSVAVIGPAAVPEPPAVQPAARSVAAWKAPGKPVAARSAEDRAAAAVKIQAWVRGSQARQEAHRRQRADLEFLGMRCSVGAGAAGIEVSALQRQARRAAEYSALAEKVEEALGVEEAEAMRQEEQEKVSSLVR